MDLADERILAVLGLCAFAVIVIIVAEFTYRRDRKKFCKCAHTHIEHNIYTGQCEHTEKIGGLRYVCPCLSFREAKDLVS